MDAGKRLKLELDLYREFKLWYNSQYITDEQLQANIKVQEELVEIFRDSFQIDEKQETADVIISEVMKLELWKDILRVRNNLPLEP